MDEIERENIQAEIVACRKRLIELTPLVGQGTTLSKDPPRISIGVTRGEFEEIQSLAMRCNTSISALGQLAFKHLLIQSRGGALPMLPPSTLENAITVTCLGREV